MLYNDTAVNKVLNINWKENWQEEAIFRFKDGLGATVEGKILEKFRIVITDDTSCKLSKHYTALNIEFTRAYKRSFDSSGEEIEPCKSTTKKVNTGYLMSSYKAVNVDTSSITLKDLLVLLNISQFDDVFPKLAANTVRVFCKEGSLPNIEINVGEIVRLKTKGNGPYVEYIARIDEGGCSLLVDFHG